MALKWGIISAGKISHDFTVGLSTLPKESHEVVAVAARSLKDAQAFAALHEIPIAYEGYETLAKDPSVEVCYVGALHTHHVEICTLLLNHGKHILCEKPMCMNARQAQQLLDLAKSKKLFFMEAIWSRFFPSYQYVKKQIISGALGTVTDLDVEFGFDHKGSERTSLKSYGAGTILDQGVYTIQLSLLAFQQEPLSIEATGELNDEGVDIKMRGWLKFKTGTSRMFLSCSEFLGNKGIIKGTKGQITINQFWCPTSIIDVDGTEKSWTLPESRLQTNYPNSVGLRYEAEEVKRCIRAGLLESDTVSHSDSITIARIQDELRRQVGVSYPCDSE